MLWTAIRKNYQKHSLTSLSRLDRRLRRTIPSLLSQAPPPLSQGESICLRILDTQAAPTNLIFRSNSFTFRTILFGTAPI
jgi:hypothetical protein